MPDLPPSYGRLHFGKVGKVVAVQYFIMYANVDSGTDDVNHQAH
jgi:hypothetical protein